MPHILHRTWYIHTGRMRRDVATEHLRSYRDQIKENDVLPHGVTAIDYFVPGGDSPTHVDVIVIPTDTWEASATQYGVQKPFSHSPAPAPVATIGAPAGYDEK